MESQTFTIPFAAQLDQGSDPKQLTTGFTEMANCHIRQRGAVSKRPGLTKAWGMSNAAATSSPERLMPVGKTLAMLGGERKANVLLDADPGNVSLYSNKLDAWEQQERMSWISPMYVEREDISAQLDSSLFDGDVAAANGYIVQAWIRMEGGASPDEFEVVVRVIDEETGTIRGEQTYDAIDGDATEYLKALKCTKAASLNIVMVTWIRGGSGVQDDLRRALINLTSTSPSFGAAGDLVTAVAGAPDGFYDVGPGPVASDDQQWLVGVELAGPDVTFRGYNSSATLVKTYVEVSEGSRRPSVTVTSTNRCAFAYFSGGYNLHVLLHSQSAELSDSTIVTAEGPGTAAETHSTALVYLADDDDVIVVWSYAPGAPISEIMGWATVDHSSPVLGAVSRVRRLRPYGHPFLVDGRAYMCVADGDETGANTTSSSQRRLHWVWLPAAQSADSPAFQLIPAATSQIGLPGTIFSRVGVLRSTSVSPSAPIENTKLYAAASTLHPVVGTTDSNLLQSQQMLTLYFQHNNKALTDFARAVQLGGQTYIAGGYVSQFDDVRFFENGFLQAPGIAPITVTAGGSVPAGTYQVKAVYEFLDDSDQIAFSLESDVKSFTTTSGGNQTVPISIEPLTLTLRQQRFYNARKVLVGLYFTPVNATGPFIRRTSYELSRIENDPTSLVALTATFSGASDLPTSSSTNPRIYTDGDQERRILRLETDAIPGCTALAAHKNRLFAAGGEDGEVIYYSLESREGEPLAFNLAQFVRISGARIVALVSLDEILYAFSKERIWAIFGEGPDDAGNSGTFLVQEVTSDVGMQWPRAWAIGRDGIYFAGRRGFYLLTRGKTVQYLGAPVETIFATFNDWRAAVVVDSRHEIRFYGRSSTGTGSGTAGFSWLTYNYETGAWAVNSNAGASCGSVADAVLFNSGLPHALGAGSTAALVGPVYHDQSECRDDNVFYAMAFTTGDLTFSQLQGLKRFRRLSVLFERSTGHPGISIAVTARNRVPASTQTETWTEAQLDADGTKDRVRLHVRDQKFTAWTVRVIDLEPTSAPNFTNGIKFSGLSCEVGHLKGVGRTSDTASR